MERKVVSGIMLILLLIGMLVLASDIQPVKASNTIFIRPDGSIDPPDAPILTVDNVTYTFADNIYDSFVVQRDNIVVDGAGYTVQGPGGGTGVYLPSRSNVTIKNMKIKAFLSGIELFAYSSNNTIFGNNITDDDHGILLSEFSTNNSIFRNNIANADHGIWLSYSSNNSIYHNNFVDNTEQVRSYYSANVWDNSYPSGGNYWSDYADVDLYSGIGQDEPCADGIWDHPYSIDVDDQDNYPLVNPWPSEPVVNITIDKPLYHYGETMQVKLIMKNPLSEPKDFFFVWYAWLYPPFGTWIPLAVTPYAVPAETVQMFDFDLPCNWGSSIWAYWIVAILEPSTMNIISQDYALWSYTPI